jgi:hypothetical protein
MIHLTETTKMPATNIAPILDQRAKKIRELMQDAIGNMLAVGAELKIARDSFDVGPKGKRMGWAKWLKTEFGISESWSGKLIRAHDKFGHLGTAGHKLPSLKVLNFLSHDHVPDEARKEVIKRVRKGEKIGRDKAKEIANKHRPSPKKAIEIASKTGKAIVASDGYLYMGASEEELKKADLRRTVIYAVRDAVETIAKLNLTPVQFLGFAHAHQLWKRGKNDHEITDAIKWLTNLERAWKMHK